MIGGWRALLEAGADLSPRRSDRSAGAVARRSAGAACAHRSTGCSDNSATSRRRPWSVRTSRTGTTHDEEAAQAWLDYARHPGILDLVAQLIGPDIVLWGSQVFCKPPVTEAMPWHQDGQYWPIRPIATCSVWMALDDATPENGCMRYIPGSHAGGSIYKHRINDSKDVVLNQEVEPSQFDESTGATTSCRPGSFP